MQAKQYTLKTAAMSLASAQGIMEDIKNGAVYSADQVARARCVIRHWQAIRARQAARKQARGV